MSARPHKKRATSSPSPAPTAAASTAARPEGTAAIDSADPRRRRWGKVVLAGVWVYIAALWLLALDQTFNWGIFGPKLPPMP